MSFIYLFDSVEHYWIPRTERSLKRHFSLFIFLLGSKKTLAWISKWNRGHFVEIEEDLSHFNSEGVPLSDLYFLRCRWDYTQPWHLELAFVSRLFYSATFSVHLRFRHVELIQVVCDCWDRSDKLQKSNEIEFGGCYRAGWRMKNTQMQRKIVGIRYF